MITSDTVLTRHLGALPGISLEGLNATAALQTRVDRKYLVPLPRLEAILTSFTPTVHVLDTDGRRLFSYDSVYFDTPDLESYHLAAFGRRRRYKIRTRSYLDAGLTFLEVKTEGSRNTTVKERIPYAPADRATITADGYAYIADTLLATGIALPRGPWQPVLETRYGRATLFLPASHSRATIDLDVTWTQPSGRRLVMTDTAVVETKSGAAAGDLDRHLWRHGVRPSRISKFGTGLAALSPHLPANRWHQTLLHSLPHPTAS